MVEPIFDTSAFYVIHGAPRCYTHVSGGSGKNVYVHFCEECGTKTHLTFERWSDRLGVYAGTFDKPDWFEFSRDNGKFIFLDEAIRGTLVPPGFKVFHRHAADKDGNALEPLIPHEVLHIR